MAISFCVYKYCCDYDKSLEMAVANVMIPDDCEMRWHDAFDRWWKYDQYNVLESSIIINNSTRGRGVATVKS